MTLGNIRCSQSTNRSFEIHSFKIMHNMECYRSHVDNLHLCYRSGLKTNLDLFYEKSSKTLKGMQNIHIRASKW